jgi:CxxC motif-containing protein (DUF1111 family)
MRFFIFVVLISIPVLSVSQQIPSTTQAAAAIPEAATGFGGISNGMVDDVTHQADRVLFDEVESIEEGLGPLYNAQSCRECHQNPLSGGGSQVTELRVGHLAPDGSFESPSIAIGDGTTIIANRSLVNDRAICPNKSFPDGDIQERVPDSETIRTTRLSLSLLGDGYVEAVADQTFINLSHQQCANTRAGICGQVVMVPIIENPGTSGVGRFGWKDQHASLRSFSADAYLNEMGITSQLIPDEVTTVCNTVISPNNQPELAGEHGAGMDDVDHFTRYIRATAAPARDRLRAATSAAIRGSTLFDQIGCSTCHVRTLVTAPAGTVINGGTFTVPPALANRQFHPFSDFLLHDVGTGDGFVVLTDEHFGGRVKKKFGASLPRKFPTSTANKIRTAPLWGLRLRPRLMHDGASYTYSDAILRHNGEANAVAKAYFKLSVDDRAAMVEFLKSL